MGGERDGLALAAGTLDVLRLFYETARELECAAFTRRLSGRRVSFKWTPEDGASSDGPTNDETKAFGVTLRHFLLDRDGISFRKIEQLSEEDRGLSEAFREEVRAIRAAINAFLDGGPRLPIPHPRNEEWTYRRLIDIWLYGSVTHLQEEERSLLEFVLGVEFLANHYASELQDALLTVLKHVFDLGGAIARELDRHGEEPPSDPPRLP